MPVVLCFHRTVLMLRMKCVPHNPTLVFLGAKYAMAPTKLEDQDGEDGQAKYTSQLSFIDAVIEDQPQTIFLAPKYTALYKLNHENCFVLRFWGTPTALFLEQFVFCSVASVVFPSISPCLVLLLVYVQLSEFSPVLSKSTIGCVVFF